MHVYFIRHGETLLNRQHRHQSPSTPLSPIGREQMVSVAELLRAVNPDLLISSEYTRALESARIIAAHTGLTPVTNGLFYEVERPSKFYGKSLFGIETAWYAFCSVLHRNNSTWRYADAENATDVSNRALKALKYLESCADAHESVAVVSHSIFINIMVSYMCSLRILSIPDLIRTFWHIERMKNGAVVHLEYARRSSEHICAWRIVDGNVK